MPNDVLDSSLRNRMKCCKWLTKELWKCVRMDAAQTIAKEVADQTSYLTQSQYTDTEPTSPIADPMMQGAWQGSHWSTNF